MKKYVLFLTVGFTLFISCQRELEFDPVNPPPPPPPPPVLTNDSILLSQLIYLDTTLAAPNDTLTIELYKYNSQKLVTITESYSYQAGTKQLDARSFYSYNGTDTVPYKTVDVLYPGFLPLPDTNYMFYQYNAQNIIIYDSSISKDQTSGIPTTHISRYNTIAADKMRRNSNYYTPPPNPVPGSYYIDYRYVFSGTNITTQVNSATPPSNLITHDSILVTYDNHPNPILKAENLRYLTVGYSDGFNAYHKNNFTTFYCKSIEPLSPNVDEYRVSFTYQYNANGYPVKAIITDLLGTATYPLGNKVIYKYTN